MPVTPNKVEAEPTPPMSATDKPPEIASASIPDTLAALKVDPDKGLARAEVETRRKEHGYNEVAVQKEHPIRKFFGKFWGMSAFPHKYSDLAVVSTLLVVNAVLSFVQEQRAAGDGALFTREDAVEAAWAAVDPVLGTHHRIHSCKPGSWGSKQADMLIAGDGRWLNPMPEMKAK